MSFDFTIDEDHWEDDVWPLTLTSLECCGWIQVSDFCDYSIASIEEQKIFLEELCKKPSIVPDSEFSLKYHEKTSFTLFCVLADYQWDKWHDWLIKLGWTEVATFLNPNTNNVCRQYIFIPDNCKIDKNSK